MTPAPLDERARSYVVAQLALGAAAAWLLWIASRFHEQLGRFFRETGVPTPRCLARVAETRGHALVLVASVALALVARGGARQARGLLLSLFVGVALVMVAVFALTRATHEHPWLDEVLRGPTTSVTALTCGAFAVFLA